LTGRRSCGAELLAATCRVQIRRARVALGMITEPRKGMQNKEE
jgi:hypothetical protein